MYLTQQNGIRILVVDDEPSVRKILTLLLRRDGYEVHAVSNGDDALAQLEQSGFNVVMTDFSMPGMKGDELAATIKHLYPGLPVIMVSALAADPNMIATLTGKVDALVGKPFSRDILRDAICRVLSPADSGQVDPLLVENSAFGIENLSPALS